MAQENPRMKSPSFERNGRSSPSLRAPVAIRVDERFDANPERVFDAWLAPDVAGRWLFATATRPIARVEIDARIGGSFRFVEQRESGELEHRGEYVELLPYRHLAFTLALADRRAIVTRVTVEIAPRQRGSALALVHENVPLDLAYGIEARWTGMLYGLGMTVDSATLDSTGGDPTLEAPPLARRGPLRRPPLGERRLP